MNLHQWDPYAEFQTASLANGLTVHVAHWPNRPWVHMGFLVHSGAEQDPVGLEGTLHFVEHLVTENAGVERDTLTDFFDNHGGSLNLGATNWDSTYYRFWLPSEKPILTTALNLVGKMLLSAQLDDQVEQQRQIIIEEFNDRFRMNFQRDLAVRRNHMVFAGTWHDRFISPIGTPESVGLITQQDLQSHYDAHYTPTNMSIVAVGGLSLDQVVELLSASPFAGIKSGGKTALPIPSTDVPLPPETRYVFTLSDHLRSTVSVGGYESIARIPGTANTRAIKILDELLDHLLTDEVRELRRWTYDVGCSWGNLRQFHMFSINCSALALRALDEIEEVVEKVLVSAGTRDDLFQSIKQRVLMRLNMIDTNARDITSGAIQDLALHHRIITSAERYQKTASVTMEDICAILRWLTPNRRWTQLTRP